MAVESNLVPMDASQAAIIEQVILHGDLAKLSPGQRVHYYRAVCQSVGVNPLTKPFDYITLNGKLTLYATKTCTDQLRNNHSISVRIVSRELLDDMYVVTAEGRFPDGRVDESTGVITLGGLKGEAKANAMMKAETKAKRRLTLSMSGLGLMDETEMEGEARTVKVDPDTGELKEIAQPVQQAPAPAPVRSPHPLVAAGFSTPTVKALVDWIGDGKPAKAWPEDLQGAFKSLTHTLVQTVNRGADFEAVRQILADYLTLRPWTPDKHEAFLTTLQSLESPLDAGATTPDEELPE